MIANLKVNHTLACNFNLGDPFLLMAPVTFMVYCISINFVRFEHSWVEETPFDFTFKPMWSADNAHLKTDFLIFHLYLGALLLLLFSCSFTSFYC